MTSRKRAKDERPKRRGPRTAADHERAINEALNRLVGALNEALEAGHEIRDPVLERGFSQGRPSVEVARAARVRAPVPRFDTH